MIDYQLLAREHVVYDYQLSLVQSTEVVRSAIFAHSTFGLFVQ